MAKVLVAYFSASGVTARVAHALAQAVGADIEKIEPAQPYTAKDLDWMDKTSRSSREMDDENCRPDLAETIDVAKYDVVFVGFPIWWGIAPRIIQTFLESGEFAGKTVVPFCTSGGSGVGKTDEVLHKCCSAQTKWKPCKRLSAAASPRELLTVVILAAMGGAEVQVRSHAEGALKTGASKEEIVCALVHAMPYMGIPRLFNALNCAKEVLSK